MSNLRVGKFKLRSIPGYGTLITLKSFIKECCAHRFIDYDGHGYYATSKGISNILVVPSDIINGNIDRSWTHVIWFDK